MSSDPNLFFFRDGYTSDEMRSRINVDHFRTDDNSLVESILEKASLERDVILENRKSDFLSKIKSNVETEEYQSFLSQMFEEHGEKGDRVKLQFYRTGELSFESLVGKLADEVEQETMTDGGDSRYSSLITDYETHDGQVVDIQFRLSDEPSDLELTEDGYVEDVDGDRVDISELGLEDYEKVVKTNKYSVEVRAYTDAGLIAVSNSKASTTLQKALRQSLRKWGDADAGNEGFLLKETELLLMQNLMDGDNSGLDFGGFLDKNLKTAKYRGDRNETLSRSPVLSPAREQGTITQARFYHMYDDGTGPRPVQVRVYHDGHISSSKPTKPDFVDTVTEHFLTVFKYRDYIQPLDELISEFIDDRFRDELYSGEDSYRSNKMQAFGSLVDQYINSNSFDESERPVFEATFANIGIELSQLDLTSDEYPEVEEASDRPEKETDLKEFFENYSDYVLKSTQPDFDNLWMHLEYVINRQSHDSPIDIIETAIEEYALRE